MAFDLNLIKHVVIVIMENRSFDHILGYLSHPDFGGRADVQGIASSTWQAHNFANPYGGQAYSSFHLEKLAPTDDPPHERDDVQVQIAAEYTWPSGFAPMNGFVANYASNPRVPSTAYPEVMGFFGPEEVPISAFFADNFVICDQWFSPLPASTQPNRLMAMGGCSFIDNTFSDSVPNQDLVYDWGTAKGLPWRVYHEGWPFFMVMPKWRLKIVVDDVSQDTFRYLNRLEADFSSPDFPPITFVEPKYTDDHFSEADPSDDHPNSSIAGGQRFLLKVYSALIKNPERWNQTLLIVTYDENGGFFDHVSPLQLTTLDPRGQYRPFKTTGIRVPAFLISPLVAKGQCFSKQPLDHTSILKFLGEKFSTDGKYSTAVNSRPVVGSVRDVLDQFGQAAFRTDRWDPPAYQPVIDVKGPPDRFTNANVKAFEHALMQLREEAPEEAARKFPEVADYFRDPKGLFWAMVQTETAAKGFKIAPECQYLLRNFVQQGEVRLLKDTGRQPIAVANLTQFLNRMMNDAVRSGSKVVHEDNFYAAQQACPMWPFC